MRPAASFIALFVLSTAASARSADMSIGDNFTVLAPNQALADAVARQAEVFRKQSALEWLGKELPDRVGRSLITVDIAPQKDEGLTWPIDPRERTLHQVWLTTSVERALGTTLHHEDRPYGPRLALLSRNRCRPGPRKVLPARPTTPGERKTSGKSLLAGRRPAGGRRCGRS